MQLRIKEFREEFGMTQKELADKIGNAQRNISNWEKGVSEPDCESILKLAEIFDTSIDDLFGREHNYRDVTDDVGAVIALVHRLNNEQISALKAFIISMRP